MQKYTKPFLLILALLIILTFNLQGNSIFQKKDYIFGTIVDIKIYGESKELASDASKEILLNFRQLHKLLHPWRKGLMYEINEAIYNQTPFLIENKLDFVGIDVIGKYLTEINVTSPTCLVEIAKQTNFDCAKFIIDTI